MATPASATENFTYGSLAQRGSRLARSLSRGVDIELDGVGNDYVGKGMGGGTIAIRPVH